MAKHIKILGQCKLPFDKILQIVTDKSTKIDASYDTERLSYHTNRNKSQLAVSKKIVELYHPKKNVAYFYRYTNDKLVELIPPSFWKKYKMIKETCRIQILCHPPGTVSIPHVDRYASMIKGTSVKKKDSKKVKRLWIALTEPRMGHALFVGNDVAYNLKRGTVLTFDKNILHSGCNVGYADRYVLTLTGVCNQWK